MLAFQTNTSRAYFDAVTKPQEIEALKEYILKDLSTYGEATEFYHLYEEIYDYLGDRFSLFEEEYKNALQNISLHKKPSSELETWIEEKIEDYAENEVEMAWQRQQLEMGFANIDWDLV